MQRFVIGDYHVMFDVATMSMVKAVWTDCEKHEDGWLTEEEVVEYIDQPLKVMHSLGWLICDDDRWVIIAQSAGNNRDGFTASEILKIPRAMVDSVVILTPPAYGEVIKGTAPYRMGVHVAEDEIITMPSVENGGIVARDYIGHKDHSKFTVNSRFGDIQNVSEYLGISQNDLNQIPNSVINKLIGKHQQRMEVVARSRG